MRNPDSFIEKAEPGAFDYGNGLVSFAIYAPYKESVHVIGTFNDWDYQRNALHEREPGYWVTVLQLDKGAYQYQFVIDGHVVICDPYAHEVAEGSAENDEIRAVLRVGEESYRWENDDWLRHKLRDLIIYEIHIGDFTHEGTFEAAADKFGYLAELGISAIEIMPVYETAPGDYWGYEPTFLMAPRRIYGSPENFRRLVDTAHAHDIAVILDMVLAHTGHTHPFNRMYPYEQSPWFGSGLGEENQFGLPTFDYLKDPTNFFVRDVEIHWLTKYHVDGFRYDYLAGIGADEEGRGLSNLMKRARDIQPDAFFIGECIPEDPGLVNGSGLSAVWHTRSRLALQTLAAEREFEPYSWSRFKEAVSVFDPGTQNYETPQFMINYFESHDDMRLMRILHEAGFDDSACWKKAALAATILMTIPGEPMVFQGQEWAEASAAESGQNKINWQIARSQEGKSLIAHYRYLCKLRRSHSCLRSDDFAISLIDEEKRCIVYERRFGESDLAVVVVNFSREAQKISISFPQSGYWHEPGGEPFEVERNTDWDIPGFEAIIFLSGKP
ncbi:MAG: alpha-amylase family glycosyl hydrolase [Syntrophales bacterium]|jgi:1,4-alpha-glucan branching enzyme|nr:alpha-amylase family glycosyl hydrolase [Syntrophales bacterium]